MTHDGDELGPAQRGRPSPGSDTGAGEVSARLAGTGLKSSTDVIDAALRMVTALAERTVENADGVSVTLERHDRLMTVAASDAAIKAMDGHQYDTGEGPCLAAKAEGRWFYIESLDEETRWPNFVPLALEQGIHSILSSPLRTADRPQGALNIYSRTERAFGVHEKELAALFATQASEILTTAGADGTDEQLNRRFADSLAARQTIAQAQGMIMARQNVSAGAAAAAMRQAARSAQISLLAYAAAMTGSSGDGAGTTA